MSEVQEAMITVRRNTKMGDKADDNDGEILMKILVRFNMKGFYCAKNPLSPLGIQL